MHVLRWSKFVKVYKAVIRIMGALDVPGASTTSAMRFHVSNHGEMTTFRNMQESVDQIVT